MGCHNSACSDRLKQSQSFSLTEFLSHHLSPNFDRITLIFSSHSLFYINIIIVVFETFGIIKDQ